jgi:hypothetical protein
MTQFFFHKLQAFWVFNEMPNEPGKAILRVTFSGVELPAGNGLNIVSLFVDDMVHFFILPCIPI